MAHCQLEMVACLLKDATEFHHGGAVGADSEAHRAAPWCPITVHLCSESRRLEFAGQVGVTIIDPLPPLVRNRVIVDSTDRLIAAPAGFAEEQRSGTWATVRYARRQGKPITIVWPDGTVREEAGHVR